jgi:hypothetical protein
MRYLVIVIIVFLNSVLFAQADTGYVSLFKGKMVEIKAEPAIYQHKKSKHFFIHFQIKNISNNNVGILLDEYFGLFYPNQWGVVTKPERGIIDERRIIPTGLNDSVINFMEAKYKNSELTLIAPGETFDYYRDFNASNKKDIKLKAGEYMYVSIDGQLLITNTANIEHAHFDDASLINNSTLFIPFPIKWKTIPADSRTFYEN